MMGVVIQKYAPKADAKYFFVKFDNMQRHVWFSTAHFSKFEPMDIVRAFASPEDGGNIWVRPKDKVEVTEYAQIPTQEVSLKLAYVSNPRRVEDEYWYMFKLETWHRCAYDVAKRYWLGDERADGLQAVDYYALLGIPEDAEASQVKKAYRKAMVEHHPDKWLVSVHGQEIHDYHVRLAKRVNAARDCLIDFGERARYDRQLHLKGESPIGGGAVRAWPGRGFGTLQAMVEDRGSVILVKEILSWEPERYTFEGSVSLSRVSRWDVEVRLKVPLYRGMMQMGQETIAIPRHFFPSPIPRRGTLRYNVKGIRTGGYSMKQKRVYSYIRVQEAEIEIV